MSRGCQRLFKRTKISSNLSSDVTPLPPTYATSMFSIQKLIAVPLHKPHTNQIPKRKIKAKKWIGLDLGTCSQIMNKDLM